MFISESEEQKNISEESVNEDLINEDLEMESDLEDLPV